ncbi:MAG: DUF177 domain-containing protein [Methylophilaceae bacterium]|nr:DUF177 domain-containing protein [Methylophilaceae bacterium]
MEAGLVIFAKDMSSSAKHLLIDSREFVEQSLEIHDKILASLLPGLAGLLTSSDRELWYQLLGGHFRGDAPMLRLKIKGVLDVRCQRCLEEMEYAVDVSRDFVLVPAESAIPEDEIEDDTADYLVANCKLDVLALVEEELLLSLPFVLAHEDNCGEAAAFVMTERASPFRVLEKLRQT